MQKYKKMNIIFLNHEKVQLCVSYTGARNLNRTKSFHAQYAYQRLVENVYSILCMHLLRRYKVPIFNKL